MRMVSKTMLSFLALWMVVFSFIGASGQFAASVTAAEHAGTGIEYETYDHSDFKQFKKRGTLDKLGFSTWDVDPSNWDAPYAVRLIGQLEALNTGTYTFHTQSGANDKYRLWVNEELVVDYWQGSGTQVWNQGTIDLVADQKYDIRVEFKAVDRSSFLRGEWESTGVTRGDSQKTQLYPAVRLLPGAVEDLAATAVNSKEVKLTFTAPGDEGIELEGRDYKGWGSAVSYDIRYSTSEITSANWAAATKVALTAQPLSAGTVETAVVSGLSAETTYHFAMKATGSAGEGALSNLTSAETFVLNTQAPAAITDLQETAPGPNYTVDIGWTAPTSWVNPGSSAGTATAYDIRYSSTQITEANWAQASKVFGVVPAPASAGTAQTMRVQLQGGESYYIAMKTMDEEENLSSLSNVIQVDVPLQQVGVSGKILLTPDMTMNLYSEGSPAMMVDEQLLVGDPKAGVGGNPTTMWETGYGQYYRNPNDAVIDLKASYELEDIYLYGKGSNGKNKIYYGSPNNWTLLKEYSKPVGSESWTHYDVSAANIQTRYLLVVNDNQSPTGAWVGEPRLFNEIVLYGKPLEALEQEPAPTPYKARETMDQFIGINAFIDDPLDLLLVAGNIREYHNWYWDEGDWAEDYVGYPNSKNAWSPSYAGGGWDFDDYYKKLHQNGVTVFPVIQNEVPWNTNKKNMVAPNSNPEIPASYAPYADHLYQYAARYGSTAVDASKLKLADSNQPLSGLGYIQYFEGGNEIDAPWEPREKMYTPFEYAARMSAAYDGHQGTMLDSNNESTFGVKQADPNATFVMAGLADASLSYSLDYIKAVKLWGEQNRDANGINGSFPGDVINLHVYTFNDEWKGLSPEAFGLKNKLKVFTDYRNRYLPDKEVWVSEFGYDVNPGSPISAQPIVNTANQVNYSSEEVQAQWLTRSYLEIAAAGVERAQMYMIRDTDGIETPGQFATSGLVTSPATGQVPRTSWYYTYTMKNTLEGLYFKEEADSGNPNVRIYKFMDENDDVKAYAVWSPTSNGTVVNNYTLALSENPDDATLVELVDKSQHGNLTPLNLTANSQVTIKVSERPVFILLDSAEEMKQAHILAAKDAIAALPEPASLTLADKAAVVAARGLVTIAIGAGAVHADITNLQKLLDCEAKLAAEYGYKIEKVGTLGRATSLKATVKVSPRPGGDLHDGAEVVVFELLDGETPVNIVAVEQDVTTEQTITAYFNVPDPSKASYKVKVFLFDQYDEVGQAPINLAASVQFD
ncbi:hypothetical protein EBB07_16715 [Paenibacillaceae bacterium]|nr:hypothetical protein EBB07_16715 [Paenibacillaceae bacterium]